MAAPQTRVRITILLPAPQTHSQYVLVDKVLSDMARFCGGVTHSTNIPPIFLGQWYDLQTASTAPIPDEIMLIIGDALVPLHSTNLIHYLETLKLQAQQDFSQDIIWITIHAVSRISVGDYQK